MRLQLGSSLAPEFLRFVALAVLRLCAQAGEASGLVWGDRPTPSHPHLVSASWAMPRVSSPF